MNWVIISFKLKLKDIYHQDYLMTEDNVNVTRVHFYFTCLYFLSFEKQNSDQLTFKDSFSSWRKNWRSVNLFIFRSKWKLVTISVFTFYNVHKFFPPPFLGVNFTNPLCANVLADGVWRKRCHLVSPELLTTLQVHTTRSYAQLLCHTLYDKKAV